MAQPVCLHTGKFPKVPPNKNPARPLNIFFYVYSVNGPLANATIKLLQYYDPATSTFKTLTKNTCNTNLPLYAVTDSSGYADLCMLSGTYIIQFSATDYDTVENQYTFINSVTVNVQLTYNAYMVTFFASGPSGLISSYEVEFIESGLPSGTSWSVTFNGSTLSSTATTITFRAYNGTYSYTVSTVDGYVPEYTSGSITVNNAPVTQDVNYVIGYDVTFVESGLATGTEWAVTFNGVQQTSTTDSITFLVANGTYSYTVGSVSGYTVSPSSGSITVNNANVTQDITFTVSVPEYIYAGYDMNPTYVDQIIPSTMTLNKTFTAPSGHNEARALTYDGTYIYAGYYTNPGIVDQINPSTMTLNKTFTSSHNYVMSLMYDGTYIYAGYVMNPAYVDKIDPSTMTLVSTFTPSKGPGITEALTYDGTYIYAGYTTVPGIVDQIIPSTMTLNNTFTAPSGHNYILALTYDGTYIYAGYSTTPGIVDQIIPSTMTLNQTFTAPSGHNYIVALTYDGTYIYAGYDMSPAYVDQIIPSTMTLNKTYTAPSGHNNVISLTQSVIKGDNYAVFK